MAIFLNNKVGVKVNNVDLSDHVSAVTINRNVDELIVTAMGDSGVKRVAGLEDSSITISFYNDTATANVLPTLQAAFGTNVTCKFVQDKVPAVSATNVMYTATCLVNGLTDINGSVSDLAVIDVTWTVSGTVALATTGTF
jgi:hypothetical protein